MVPSVNKCTGGIQGHFSFSEMFVCTITSQEESFQLLQCHPGYKAICFFVIITVANIESKYLYPETETLAKIAVNSYL